MGSGAAAGSAVMTSRAGGLMTWRQVADAMRSATPPVQPNLLTFNKLIDCCAKLSLPHDAEAFYLALKKQRLKPDYYTFSALIMAVADTSPETAIDAYNLMLEEGIAPTAPHYSALLLGQDSLDSCLEVFEEMRLQGVRPNRYVYSILIHRFALEREWLDVERLYDEAMERGIETDVVFFGSALNAFSKAGHWHAFLGVLRDMKASGEQGSTIFYNIAMQGLEHGEQERLMLDMYEEMRWHRVPAENSNTQDKGQFFRTVLRACAKLEMPLDSLLSILEDAMAHDFKPDTSTYNTILASCARLPAPDCHLRASSFYRVATAAHRPLPPPLCPRCLCKPCRHIYHPRLLASG
ncbi:hypothetical protein CYMTET_35539 [Cymbomonas tetramitiformis]|uniref:Pentacotripeptide-repeat region of PRORP domain-containing protein n=1 Tax=Cymbomonas tetramitiformis TaxID=36881 RepID=A0AAE0F932_9CHLO|nr:hypothetical protein CYMTET_35539 [Cymbomonas tetramitiformis]